MPPVERPIPAFWCCYLLRSTIRHKALYVGSTPDPARRLKQHNGIAKGGAVKTSRRSLQPWEMTALVTGFPSHVAALQFEWAWQNYHVTLHIPSTSRLNFPTAKKSSGRNKRPTYSIVSLLRNLHLLLRVPSFSRWPLELRFFAPDVHDRWSRLATSTEEKIRDSIPVLTDFHPKSLADAGYEVPSSSQTSIQSQAPKSLQGVQALDVTHKTLVPHLIKSKDILEFEQEGSCSICSQSLSPNSGIYVTCLHDSCKAVSHISCLSKHFIETESNATAAATLTTTDDNDFKLPLSGNCASCGKESKWIDIVKEVTMRSRGGKELDKLLKPKRVKANVKKPAKIKGPRGRPRKSATPSTGPSSDAEDEGPGSVAAASAGAVVAVAATGFSSNIEGDRDEDSDLTDLDTIFGDDLDGIEEEDEVSPRKAAKPDSDIWHEIGASDDNYDTHDKGSVGNVAASSGSRKLKDNALDGKIGAFGDGVIRMNTGTSTGKGKGKGAASKPAAGKPLVIADSEEDWDDVDIVE